MTTIRVVPSSTSTTTSSNHAPPIRPPDSRRTLDSASSVDTLSGGFVRGNFVGPISTVHSGQEKKARGSGEAQSSRFSFVAFEKARKFVAELPLREKASQQQASSDRASLARLDESAASSAPTSPTLVNPLGAQGSQSSRESFSTAASSPREGSDDLSTPRSINARFPISHVNQSTSDLASDDTATIASQSEPRPKSDATSGKMHQTSSRLLRMTDDERPYTKDFMDLFSTLMVSLPLTSHRVRFQKVDHSFTSEEAINNLGSLKFSQSNRMPDPKDSSRIVTTTTTTTFSMAKEMAKNVCQRFLEARFIEPADGKPQVGFPLKGPVWLLTPKGIAVLQRFCARNGIQQRHVLDLIESSRNTLNLVILERDQVNDRLSHDQATVEVIFRRFAGLTGPNVRNAGEMAESEYNDHYNGQVGIKQAAQRALGNKIVLNTFTGKGVVDWLMDCTSIIDRRETVEIADLFIKVGLMEIVVEDKLYARDNPVMSARFQPTRAALYSFTARGRKLAGHDSKGDDEEAQKANGGPSGQRETNNNRLERIVNEPSWRLLFREYLVTTHCEENLSFYLEVKEFTDSYDQAEKAKAFIDKNDAIRENLAAAYGLYNAYLAPGSPNELNIDHNLRNGLAGRMTRAVGNDESMLRSLKEVVDLFKAAQNDVFKLMASDSVPKFLKDPKFAKQLRDQKFEHGRDPSPPAS